MVVVRHLRCRREEWSSLHGFALRASPAVKHGVSPLGTVGTGWEFSLSPLIHGFTLWASPAVTHGVSSPGTVGAALIIKSLYSLCGESISALHITPLLSQLHPRSVTYASGGGAPCLTAGDARAVARVNPWGGQRGLRRRRRHTASVEGVKRCVSKSGCCATPPVSERGVEFSPRVRPSGITRG